jgi:lipid A 4'-phosphatase
MNGTLPPARFMVASALAFALHFLALPQLDLIANGAFYSPAHGFLLRDNAVFDAVHKYLGILAAALLTWAATIWLLAQRAHNKEKWRSRRPAALFLALSLLLGPGLMVNGVFKDHWGRARPGQVLQFGGSAHFSPPWVMSDQCEKNCSFVCGDASLGYVLVAIAFVSRRPRLWFAAGLVLGSALGLMRMGQGGHFLSDVIFSFYVVYFTAWALHRFMTRGGRALQPLD